MKTLHESIDLTGKVAVVTGGAMGIGEGIVRRLAEAGAHVVIADINFDAAEKAAEAIQNTHAVEVDVADAGAVERLVSETVSKFGRIDILVNNAGIYPNKLIGEMDEDMFNKILSVNLTGAFLCTKACTEQMITQGGGKVINITSIDALHPSMPGLSAYDASKHGLWGFTKTAALEFAKDNIQVNAIAPGGINTPGTGSDNTSEEVQKNIEAFKKLIPMGRMGESDEIGKVALFLVSDLSSYMTGSQIVVDGGRLLS